MANATPKFIMRRPSMAPTQIAKLTKRNESLYKSVNSKDEDVEIAVNEKTEKKVKQFPKACLSDNDLDAELIIHLTAENPNANKNEVFYSFKEMNFQLPDKVNHLVIHYECESKIVSKFETVENDENTPNESGLEEIEEKVVVIPSRQSHDMLVNQFNYSDRITQTPKRLYKTKGVQTEPPQTSSFSADAIQWVIYDFYTENENMKGKPKETEKHVLEVKSDDENAALKGGLWRFKIEPEKIDLSQLADSVRIMERITNQNTFDEITQDFKYWDDLSDELKTGRGSLLPLWKFHFDEVKDLHVTDVSWNSIYDDLFAVSYGSYDFMKQKAGVLSIFSLSNPSYPEYLIKMNSGIMCIDIHHERPNLIVTGMYDGNVAVFDLQDEDCKPICESDPSNGKHSGSVWKVKWQLDDIDGNLNFCSASSDGRVTYWTVVKRYLLYSDLLIIKRQIQRFDDITQPVSSMNASVMAIAFHPQWPSIFLVGTDDGHIYLCNKDYVQGILVEYEKHDRAVNTIQWNYFHPNIFITCSPDHTVKTWHYQQREPLWTYEMESPVMDTKWAPYSSTVFATITKDGKAYVYDLHVHKYQPMCVQVLVSKLNAHPTSLTFSNTQPCILVGDLRGCVRVLKLSPNLRKSLSRVQQENYKDLEIAALEKYIAIMENPKSKVVL